MQTADFDYPLPPELIAQSPAARRDQSRLLTLDRASGALGHGLFSDLPGLLRPGDALVLNNSRVIPARLHGRNARSGGAFEILLLEENAPNDWWAMMRPAKRARPGTRIQVLDADGTPSPVLATVLDGNEEGHRRLRFSGCDNLMDLLDRLGEAPLPPYITRPESGPTFEDLERYQTVYARPAGSVAAPTAGLHFTAELLDHLRRMGVGTGFVTLHVGPGTFAPVKAGRIEEHRMHEERYEIAGDTIRLIAETRNRGGRVVAVGTTSVRVLESVAEANGGMLVPGTGRTRIFIYPPRRFQVVDALITNFHLPCSTLLMLVSAFASPGETGGRARMLEAYAEAVRLRYRFFSYGDAMLIT
jgi:S-adenosylmethionine:tRNA ribosyltransferase-isomerase